MTKTHTSEMVERVARAILDDTPPWLGLVHDWDTDEVRLQTVREFVGGTYMQGATKQIALCAARAAIKAMREPNDEMVKAGWLTGIDNTPCIYWQAMIDAAL